MSVQKTKTSLRNKDLPLDSVVLKRLIEEVESRENLVFSGYNRTYNRHNR